MSLSQFKQRADLIEQIIRAGEDNTPSDVEVECNRYGYESFEEILLTTKKRRKKGKKKEKITELGLIRTKWFSGLAYLT